MMVMLYGRMKLPDPSDGSGALFRGVDLVYGVASSFVDERRSQANRSVQPPLVLEINKNGVALVYVTRNRIRMVSPNLRLTGNGRSRMINVQRPSALCVQCPCLRVAP